MRAEKTLLLEEVKQKLQGSKAFIITKYVGLTAIAAHNLRLELGKCGAELEVVRKRVFVKAAEMLGVPLNVKELQGHIGVVFANDEPLEATKAIVKYGEDNEQVVSVLGARLDGQLYSAKDVVRLAKLPSMNDMRAQILGLLVAPMAQVLAVMEALIDSKKGAESTN